MVNRVFLLGRLGKEPELRYTPQGTPVANFPLATDRKWRDRNGNLQSQTEWHNIVIMGKQAETAASYLKKGSLIFLEGRIQTRNWEDKDGNRHYRTEIVARNFRFLDRKPSEETAEDLVSPEMEETDTTAPADIEDDVPF